MNEALLNSRSAIAQYFRGFVLPPLATASKYLVLWAAISFVVFLCAIASPRAGFAQDENSAANTLFRQAIGLFAEAQALEGSAQNAVYSNILTLLEHIEAEYPDTTAGRRLAAGKPLGPIDPMALELALGRVPEGQTDSVAQQSTDNTQVSYSPVWVDQVVRGGRIGNGYGFGQFPSLDSNTHLGIDIGGGCGLRVHTPLAGKVVKIVTDTDRDFGSVGNAVVIDHGVVAGRRTYTAYFHLRQEPEVVLGAISDGALLGYVGDTGAAEGCHLHFEVRHFEGTRGLFHPAWGNIYGKGDQRASKEFARDWSDPARWLAARDDPTEQHFAEACAAADLGGSEIACPYVEPHTCMGEVCSVEGALKAQKAFDIYAGPHSDTVLARVAAGDYLVHRTSTSYTVPCHMPLMRAADIGLTGHSPVYRVGYAGEGHFRYFSEGAIAVAQDPYLLDESGAPTCGGPAEVWYNVVTRDGTEGWVENTSDLPVLGASHYTRLAGEELMEGGAGHWVLPHLSETGLGLHTITRSNPFCSTIGLPLNRAAINAIGASRGMDRRKNGLTYRFWTSRAGPNLFHTQTLTPQGELFLNASTVDETGLACADQGEQARQCAVYYPCLASPINEVARAPGRSILAESTQHGPFAVAYGLDAQGDAEIDQLEAAYARQPIARPISDAMLGYDWDDLYPCAQDFAEACLLGQGLSDAAAKGYVRLSKVLDGDPSLVRSYKIIGRYTIADITHFQRANSNDQTLVFNGMTPVDILGPIHNLLSNSSDREAAALRRAFPRAFADVGRGRLSYLRFKGDNLLVYYSYPIMDGCRACEVVGSVTVETEISPYGAQSNAVYWGRDAFRQGGHAFLNSTFTKIQNFAMLSRAAELAQVLLKSAGFYKGAIDGDFGRGSQRALLDFQHEHCLSVTGQLDANTADALANKAALFGGCYDG